MEAQSLGISIVENILDKLKEKNILLLDKQEEILNNLNYENANIKKTKQKIAV